ncbi:hypothetical protein SNE26_29035 [Mucilaginibacter sp. cycad4]|uniref:hypothetical protein n=1 Tax=Mucilaginibacter sp. cycad4 TaxID=3342096 RepID=UPI002AAA939B|nr:hypothetical protein [Mucilaginibacter gossypii]WPV00060.1 hypothetical protein SNE26_29035 [Mucilaginibacter gossypii]
MTATKFTRYWFEFEFSHNIPPGLGYGCGITAYSYDDALGILSRDVFKGGIPTIKNLTENIDVSTLDAGHVLPNILPPTSRGVWFPYGYKNFK